MESASQTFGSTGGTATTDTELDGATPFDPVETSVTSPTAGSVTIQEMPAALPPPSGFQFIGQQVNVSAPAASPGNPLVIVFRLDGSIVPSGENQETIQVFRNGVLVPACTGGPGVAAPDPCVSSRTLVGNDVQLTVLSSTASVWSLGRITASARCAFYPITLHRQTVAGLQPGALITNILNGTGPGNFGWLTWTGNASEPTLVRSLTPPGDSNTYTNALNPADHVVSVGDWVQGKPGTSDSQAVRSALDALKTVQITVPLWDLAEGQGNNARYRVAGFARVQLTEYRLPGESRISARFLASADCP